MSLAMVGPAPADEALFEAMSLMAKGTGMADVLPPTTRDGNYVEISSSRATAFGDVISPGPSACSVIQTAVRQERGAFAQVAVKTLDFSKIVGVRYLGPEDDYLTGPSRDPEDPEVEAIALDGEAWLCDRLLHVDPAAPSFTQWCDDSWQITLLGEDDKRAARAAVERIQASCFSP